MNTQQQSIARERNIEANIYVKGSYDSNLVTSTMNQLNAQPGITSVEPSTDRSPMIAVRFDPQQTWGNNIVKSLRTEGKRWNCITFMYCKGGDGADFEHRVLQTVTAMPGVIAAERSRIKGHAFIIHFDQRETKASRIVSGLRNQGYTALIVGC